MVFCVLSKSECLERVQEYLELLKFFLKVYTVGIFFFFFFFYRKSN